MGKPVEFETDAERLRPEKSEVERLCADNSKAKELTGWQPLYAGLDGFRKGIKETVDWFQNQNNLKLYKTDRYNL